MAIGDFEMELLMTKLDYLQDKLQEVEQTMKAAMESSLKETEHRLQEKLTKLENNINEKIGTIEVKIQAMEDSLKMSVKTSEEKIIQEKTQTDLKLLGENNKTLEMLTDSLRNISIQSKFNTQLLHIMHTVNSCRQALNVSGKYIIQIALLSEPFKVLCEQNKFNGGWIVIQHRYDGSVNFYRNWMEYRDGFGSLDSEFWLGLEYVHQITKNRPHELLVEVKDFVGNYGYAKYKEFEIGSESEKYALKKLGTYSGTAGDAMQYQKNRKFSTFDRDNDESQDGNCAQDYHGAWWYSHYTNANLNGPYQNTIDDLDAMVWIDFKTDWRSMSYTRMMIREIIN